MLCLTNGMCVKTTVSLCIRVHRDLDWGQTAIHLVMSQAPRP